MSGAIVVHLAGTHRTMEPKIRLMTLAESPQNIVTKALETGTPSALFESELHDNFVWLRPALNGAIPVIALMNRAGGSTAALAARLKLYCTNAMRRAGLSSDEVRLELIAPVWGSEGNGIETMKQLVAPAEIRSTGYLVSSDMGADSDTHVAFCASLFITTEKSRMWPYLSFSTLREESPSGIFVVDLHVQPIPRTAELAKSLLCRTLWTRMFVEPEQGEETRFAAARELLRQKCDSPAWHSHESFRELRRDFLDTVIPALFKLLGPAKNLRIRQVELKDLARDLYEYCRDLKSTKPALREASNTHLDVKSRRSGDWTPVLANVLEELSTEWGGLHPPAAVPVPEFLRLYESEILDAARREAEHILARCPFPVFLFLPLESRPRAAADPLFLVYGQAVSALELLLARKIHDGFRERIATYDEATKHIGGFQFARPVWRLFSPEQFSFDSNDELHHSSLMGWVAFRRLV